MLHNYSYFTPLAFQKTCVTKIEISILLTKSIETMLLIKFMIKEGKHSSIAWHCPFVLLHSDIQFFSRLTADSVSVVTDSNANNFKDNAA